MSLRPDQLIQAADVLIKLPLFSGSTPQQCAAIAAVMNFKVLVSGKVVLLEQEISKTLYILSRGSVGIWRRVANNKERVAMLRAPDCFGEVSMFSDSPATALVKTEEDSQFFMVSRERFDALVAKDPSLSELIRRNMETLKAQRPTIQKSPTV
jgi:CRP/FNR family cyclic AMP-dependent transcriptional regulator